MTRVFFIAAACLTFSAGAMAQRDEGATLGARLGINYSFLNFGLGETESMPGLSAGLFSKGPVAGDWSIQPELSGTLERARIKSGTGEKQLELTFYYAEATFMAAYNAGEHFTLYAGPFIEYLVHMQQEGDWNEAIQAGVFDKENFRVVNLGFIYGAVYEFRRFDAGLRFNHGLYVIGKEITEPGYAGALETKNSFIQLYGAYVF